MGMNNCAINPGWGSVYPVIVVYQGIVMDALARYQVKGGRRAL
jgi:hypothetical protein